MLHINSKNAKVCKKGIMLKILSEASSMEENHWINFLYILPERGRAYTNICSYMHSRIDCSLLGSWNLKLELSTSKDYGHFIRPTVSDSRTGKGIDSFHNQHTALTSGPCLGEGKGKGWRLRLRDWNKVPDVN